MDYTLSRAHELARLDSEMQIKLRIAENNKGRCFYPHEIQSLFNLPDLKTAYMIPEIEAGQANHSARLNNEFHREGLYPRFRKVQASEIDEVHQFDHALIGCQIDFVYQGGKSSKKLRDQIQDEI